MCSSCVLVVAGSAALKRRTGWCTASDAVLLSVCLKRMCLGKLASNQSTHTASSRAEQARDAMFQSIACRSQAEAARCPATLHTLSPFPLLSLFSLCCAASLLLSQGGGA